MSLKFFPTIFINLVNFLIKIFQNAKIATLNLINLYFFLEEEQRLHDHVHEWASEYLDNFRQKERERNRTRVLELNHFLDSNKKEVNDLDIIPHNQFAEDDL